MTEVPMIQKPVNWFAYQINGWLAEQVSGQRAITYYKDLRHEKVNFKNWHNTYVQITT